MTVSYKKVSIIKSNYYLDGFLDKANAADEVGVFGANWLIVGPSQNEACSFFGLQSPSSFTSADVERFRLLAKGLHPNPPHQPLVANVGYADRVALHDFTLSAPKSVSVVWALSPAETALKIERVQHLAAKAFLAVMADRAAETRQGRGGRIRSRCPLISVLFQHSTSRDLDPQLHTHATVFNLTLRHDGSSGAIEVKQMLRWIGVAATVYHSELARGLLNIGFEIDLSPAVFEIKGVPTSVIRLFSKRRVAAVAAAKAEMIARGRNCDAEVPTWRQMQCAVIKTRRQKRAIPLCVLRKEWLGSAQEVDMRFTLNCRTGALANSAKGTGSDH